jgi:hypothetical protein
MSTDALKRLDGIRSFYQSSQTNTTSSDVVKELQQIKNEAMIANDERASAEEPITNALHSPYLTDQKFYRRDVIKDSAEEILWKKDLPSYEDVHGKLVEYNLKKLNII